MTKIRQNIVLLIEPNDDTFFTPERIAHSFANLFVMNEEAGFELSSINYLHKSSFRMESTKNPFLISEKGMDTSN